VNAPFFLFTTAGTPQRLFGQAAIGGPNCVIFAGCRVVVHIHGGVGVITARLQQQNKVGILVQRVVGTRRVNGRRVPRLKRVGRVPLGKHRAGRLNLRWNLRVNHKQLRPRARYLITLRALDRVGRVLGVTKPVIVRLH
jgi:hypothetical protein